MACSLRGRAARALKPLILNLIERQGISCSVDGLALSWCAALACVVEKRRTHRRPYRRANNFKWPSRLVDARACARDRRQVALPWPCCGNVCWHFLIKRRHGGRLTAPIMTPHRPVLRRLRRQARGCATCGRSRRLYGLRAASSMRCALDIEARRRGLLE